MSGRTPIPSDPPRILPPSWRPIPGWEGPILYGFVCRWGLKVLYSSCKERDGKRWLHVSVSHHARLPRWDELREVKDLFIGKDKVAVQVLPREAEYVNHHPYVLHLWHCLDGDPVPDFRGEDGLI